MKELTFPNAKVFNPERVEELAFIETNAAA
jgi:hypothetical protein